MRFSADSRDKHVPREAPLLPARLMESTVTTPESADRPAIASISHGNFLHDGHRLHYEVHGSGPRVLIYTHGLLLDSLLNRSIAQALAARGHRVILLDLLGHGSSDRPTHAYDHRFDLYGEQVIALMDHLGLDEAAVGGISLGANTTLAAAAIAPHRVRAMVVEMPVLERGAIAAVAMFTPLLVSMRYFGWAIAPASALVRALPRPRHAATASVMNALSRTPRQTAAVLHGIFFGPGAPTAADRAELDMPTLVIGHGYDLLHPMDDAEALSRELPNAELFEASTMLEARTSPARVVAKMDDFLAKVWKPAAASSTAARS